MLTAPQLADRALYKNGVPKVDFSINKYTYTGRQMTGDESRQLKVGDRVQWGAVLTDLGTVVSKTWSGVTIKWDDGQTALIPHNDMRQVEYVPKKLV